MNDSEFEKDLQELLKPARPSARLYARIRSDLREPVSAARTVAASSGAGFFFRLLRNLGWACAGAAAAMAAVAFTPVGKEPVTPPHPAPAAIEPTNAFEHEETSNELVSAEDSDQFVETDDGPAQEVRYDYRERHEWSNPQTGARVVLEVPREDVYLLPVSLQ